MIDANWQDFETAPRDGTDFLAFGPFLGMLVLEFDDSARDPDFPWATLDGPNYYNGAFSHWMPLPAKPEIADVNAP